MMTLNLTSFLPLKNTQLGYAGGIAALIAISVVLYNKCLLRSKNSIPLPPGPPARWFWCNALPTVK